MSKLNLPPPSESSEATGSRSAFRERFELPADVYTLSLWMVVLISTLKSLRPPNLWATTQLTFNYSHGFIRRGLMGEIVRLIGLDAPYRYNVLAAIASGFFVIAAVWTLFLIRQGGRSRTNRGVYQLATLVAFASPAIMFIVHIAGYLDNVGMAVMLIFVVLYTRKRDRSSHLGFLSVSLLSIPLALVHENLVVMFGPVMVFAVVCVRARQLEEESASVRERFFFYASIAAAAAVCIAATLLIAGWGTRSKAEIDALRHAVSETATFVPRKDVFTPLYRDIRANFFDVMPHYFAKPRYWRSFFIALFTVLPASAFLLYVGWRRISRLHLARSLRLPVRALFLAACLSPLSMHLFGLDKPRWNAISVFCSFAAVSVLQIVFGDRTPGDSEVGAAFSRRTVLFAIVAAALGLAGGSQMFDHETVRMYPYEGGIEFFIQWIQGGFSYIPKY